MRNLIRFLFVIFVILFVTGSIFYFVRYKKVFTKASNFEAFNAIPENAVFILETSDLYKAYNQIVSSQLWKGLMKTDLFDDLSQRIAELNNFLLLSGLPDKFFADRNILLAGFVNRTIELMFVIDLKDLSNASSYFLPLIKNLPDYKTFTFNFKSLDGKNYIIYELVYLPNQYEKWYISAANNLLLVSTDKKVIKNALNGLPTGNLLRNKYFSSLKKSVKITGVLRFYFNFKYLDALIKTFQSEIDPIVMTLSNNLNFAILDLSVDGNTLKLQGSVGIDSNAVYFNTLKSLKPAHFTIWETLSIQSAGVFTFGIENFEMFYKKLQQDMHKFNPDQYQMIQRNIRLLEKSLGIDFQDDLISWIGEQIAICKLTPNSDQGSEDVMIIFETKNLDSAKLKLDKVFKRIARRTPLQLKTINYNGYEIKLLKISGLFSLLLGQLTTEIEKPYYTFVDKYVVFSNSPVALEKFIDDYSYGSVLSNNVKFKRFVQGFKSKASFNVFILMPNLFQTVYFYANQEDRAFLRKYKDLIISFSQIGLQLINENKNFQVVFKVHYDSTAKIDYLIQQYEKQIQLQRLLQLIDTLNISLNFSDSLASYSGLITIFYPDTKCKLYEGNLEDGYPTGLWRVYYKDGNLKMTLLYDRKGKLTGSIQLFYDNKPNSKLAQIPVKHNTINGTVTVFYEDGSKMAEIQYRNGKRNGKVIYYYPNGKVKLTGHYKNKLKNGQWILYDTQGNKIAVTYWRSGKQVRSQ